MKLDILLKNIEDRFVRDGFFRLLSFLRGQKILDANWTFYEVEFQAGTRIPVRHGLSFTPKDVVVLSIVGNYNAFFNYADFDATNVYVTAAGPCRIRFLLGRFEEQSYGGAYRDIPFVPPS